MHYKKKGDENRVGNSIYQKESHKYYAIFRQVHSKALSFNPERLMAEKKEIRYSNSSPRGVKNLYTFINLLHSLLSEDDPIKGIDYGCGNHFFIDVVQKEFDWDVVGYDVDRVAIQLAHEKYKVNGHRYRHLDLIKKRLPESDDSQHFIFCNAVIQHFSDAEVAYALADMNRVLRMNGILLLIFKRNVDDWKKYSADKKLHVDIIDADEGIIQIEDVSMKKAIQEIDPSIYSTLAENCAKGLRTFHFFSIDKVIHMAHSNGFEIMRNINFNGRELRSAVFKYYSGKNIPTAALYFQKSDKVHYLAEKK